MKLVITLLGLCLYSLGAMASPNINIGRVFDYMDAGHSS